MRTFKTFASALVVALVAITSLDYAASAATGHAFVLGQLNKANRVTVLKRTTSGSALGLTTSPSSSPLTVNGRGKVVNLNADRVDGLDSTALAGVRARVFRFVFDPAGLAHEAVVATLAPGSYLATLDVPMIGGGGSAAAPATFFCEFLQFAGGTRTEHAITQGSSTVETFPSVTATTVLRAADGNLLSLGCTSTKVWGTTSRLPAEVSLTKLDGASFEPTTTPPES